MVLLQMTPLTRPAIRQQRTRRGWIGTWLISLVIELFHYRLPKGDEIDRNQGHEYSASHTTQRFASAAAASA
ncbi:hypothetical protein [Bradyrhizobium sp. WD16]|uniref:hypothetical protein n=1 Tax=Bradyrhizobium sp. WD16 TaxID=1521768 RepID=UPI0020A2DD7F|nr:hypothetical protein [Bradyrhizobium sp. WD16]UTD27879.1 hypothetical protein DB459_14095 [Bradyrhizobium sp. WD16]